MSANKFYRSSLPAWQVPAYDSICDGLFGFADTIKFFAEEIELEDLIDAVRLDNPELYFWGDNSYRTGNKLSRQITLRPQYLSTLPDIVLTDAEIDDALSRIIARIPRTDDWHRVVAVHDLMCERIVYEDDGADAHSIVGALLHRRAVCEGIAKAFKMICDRLGIDCAVVRGRADGSGALAAGGVARDGEKFENHAWNKVKIGGKWFNVDVTFDLTVSSRAVRHDRLFLSDKKIGATHIALMGKQFACVTESMDYYAVNGLVMPNQRTFLEYVKAGAARGERRFEIRLPSAKDAETVVKKVMYNVKDALSELDSAWRISIGYDKNLLVFSIELTEK